MKNLNIGFIWPTFSLYNAPVLFIKKKDSSLCLCIDFHSFNHISKKNCYPLLLISDLLVMIDTFRIQRGDGLRVWWHKWLRCSKSQSVPHVVGADISLSLHCFLMFYDVLDSWLLSCYNMFTHIYSIDTILYSYTLPLQSIPLSTLKSLPKCNLSFSLRS